MRLLCVAPPPLAFFLLFPYFLIWIRDLADHKVLLLGLVQSLFEGSMYTFVFMWTPALQAKSDEELPFGVIFASYMVCVMIGSAVFSMAIQSTSAEQLCRVLLLVAAGSLCVPVLTLHPYAVLLGFLLFEICCGMWWPTIGTLRYVCPSLSPVMRASHATHIIFITPLYSHIIIFPLFPIFVMFNLPS